MTTQAVVLVLVSTVLHASWNLMARRRRAEGEFFRRLLLITALVGIGPAVIAEWRWPTLSPRILLLAGISGIFGGLYYLGLARAYAMADFTTVYPVARALPVLMVAGADLVRGRWLPPVGWLGLALVTGGCLLAPLESFRDVSLARYFRWSSGWMLVTAAGTVGYTIVDKLAAESIASGPGAAARYCYAFFLASAVWYAFFRLCIERAPTGATSRDWRLPAIGAACSYTAYWLVVWVYQLVARASYVVAFRQFSIVLGVMAAFILYREKGVAVRTTGAVAITAGLVCLALWAG